MNEAVSDQYLRERQIGVEEAFLQWGVDLATRFPMGMLPSINDRLWQNLPIETTDLYLGFN
ncbi:hypothetical protein D3C80_1752050 [compost metagenome]